jgi:hypothetical protein
MEYLILSWAKTFEPSGIAKEWNGQEIKSTDDIPNDERQGRSIVHHFDIRRT